MFSDKKHLKKLKTGPIERRLSLAKAGVLAGARYARRSASTWLLPEEERLAAKKRNMSDEAAYFVAELGKLKGSVVKVGQTLALWGEAFLPKEVTEALHALDNQTFPMAWPELREQLVSELGANVVARLEIHSDPLGCASLAQVHLAKAPDIESQLCLKIQYPGVSDSIDSDLAAIAYWLQLTRLVPASKSLESWLSVIREMLHNEVDYERELAATQRFVEYLAEDTNYVVPKPYPELCSPRVLASQYQAGVRLNDPTVLALSQTRRNRLGLLCIDLFWKEVMQWGELQTDPNLGNYLVKLQPDEQDQLVLLDFGAIYCLSPSLMRVGKQLIVGAVEQDREAVKQALLDLDFLSEAAPEPVFEALYQLVELALEPFLTAAPYDWGQSDIVNRIARHVTNAAFSRHFKMPPKELVFVSRKILGAYTILCLLNAILPGKDILQPYLSLDFHAS